MTILCITTGRKKITCDENGCLHYCNAAEGNCLQYIYDKPITKDCLSDLADLIIPKRNSKHTVSDAKRLLHCGEEMIASWGRILNKLDETPRMEFTKFISHLYAYDHALATAIANDLYLYIIPPMRYVASDRWCGIVIEHKDEMTSSKLASDANIETWNRIEYYRLL
jgi:hypothetical protein